MDVDLQLVGGALHVDARDTGVGEALLQLALQLQVLVQQLRVITIGVPARAPGLVEAEPESVWMNLLTHVYASFFERVLACFCRPVPALAPPVVFFAPRLGAGAATRFFSARSETATVK